MNLAPPALGLLLTLLSLISSSAAAQAPTRLPEAWPPGPASDLHWGTRVPDPYRELENVKDCLLYTSRCV